MLDELQPKARAMSRKQLAEAYGITTKTLRGWLAPFALDLGVLRKRILTPNQVKAIFEKIGAP